MPKNAQSVKRRTFLGGRAAPACVLLVTALAAGAGAQSGLNRPKPQSDKPEIQQESHDSKDGALKLNSTVVNIAAVVTDRSGRYIPQLTKDDFEVFEDGAHQQVAFFANEEVPFNVALLMDVSGSVSDSLKDIKKAAIEFVHQLRPNDRVMVASFDERVRYLTDFTNDRRALESAINSCQTGHGTSVYDSVYDTVTARFRGIEGRKALLLLSDGEDTTSQRVSYDQAIDRVAESDVLVYGLRYPDTGGRGGWGGRGGNRFPGGRRWPLLAPVPMSFGLLGQFPGQYPQGGQYPLGGQRGPRGQRGPYGRHRGDGRDFMKDVTEAGGGPLFDAKSNGDLRKLAPQIADELRHVYAIGYYPTKALSEGGYRTVKIKVKGRDELAVRHRRGYDARQTAPQPAG